MAPFPITVPPEWAQAAPDLIQMRIDLRENFRDSTEFAEIMFESIKIVADVLEKASRVFDARATVTADRFSFRDTHIEARLAVSPPSPDLVEFLVRALAAQGLNDGNGYNKNLTFEAFSGSSPKPAPRLFSPSRRPSLKRADGSIAPGQAAIDLEGGARVILQLDQASAVHLAKLEKMMFRISSMTELLCFVPVEKMRFSRSPLVEGVSWQSRRTGNVYLMLSPEPIGGQDMLDTFLAMAEAVVGHTLPDATMKLFTAEDSEDVE